MDELVKLQSVVGFARVEEVSPPAVLKNGPARGVEPGVGALGSTENEITVPSVVEVPSVKYG